MPNPAPPQPQTGRSALGEVLGAILAFGAVYAISGYLRGISGHAVEGVMAGMIFGTIKVATAYWRLPRSLRLPPPHAIGLGILNFSLLAWDFVTRIPAPIEWFITIALIALLALPAAYLIAAAVRQLFDESRQG